MNKNLLFFVFTIGCATSTQVNATRLPAKPTALQKHMQAFDRDSAAQAEIEALLNRIDAREATLIKVQKSCATLTAQLLQLELANFIELRFSTGRNVDASRLMRLKIALDTVLKSLEAEALAQDAIEELLATARNKIDATEVLFSQGKENEPGYATAHVEEKCTTDKLIALLNELLSISDAMPGIPLQVTTPVRRRLPLKCPPAPRKKSRHTESIES